MKKGITNYIEGPESQLFNTGPAMCKLRAWRSDFDVHKENYQPVLEQIILRNRVSSNNLDLSLSQENSNVNEHLKSVLSACKEKVNGADLHTNFSLDNVRDKVFGGPSLNEDNTPAFRVFNAFYLKCTSLIENFRYADLPSKKLYYGLTDNNVINGDLSGWQNRYNTWIGNGYLTISKERKEELIQQAIEKFLKSMPRPGEDLFFPRKYAYCLKMLAESNEPITGLLCDQTLGLTLGAALFIDVYPILKEPGMLKLFTESCYAQAVDVDAARSAGIKYVPMGLRLGRFALAASFGYVGIKLIGPHVTLSEYWVNLFKGVKQIGHIVSKMGSLSKD